MTSRTLWLAFGFTLVLLLGVGTRAGADPSPTTVRCSADSTPAVVGQRRVCLREGANCRPRYQRQYRRHGFACFSGLLGYDWKPLRRPLRIPVLTPSSVCPATAPTGTIRDRGGVDMSATPAFGPGPALPAGLHPVSGSAVLWLTWTPTGGPSYAGWWGTKVLWTVPRYDGAVLIRGGQLDGENALGFDLGPQFTRRVLPELRLTGRTACRNLRPCARLLRVSDRHVQIELSDRVRRTTSALVASQSTGSATRHSPQRTARQL